MAEPGDVALSGVRGRIRRFFREARRRRVVQTGIVYTGVVLVVVEGASLFQDALTLPGDIVTIVAVLAILGFPIALGLAWVFDVSLAGPTTKEAPTREATTKGAPTGAPTEKAATEEAARGDAAEDRERWSRVMEIFQGALAVPAAEVDAHLARVTGDDPALRREVGELLQAHHGDGPVDRMQREIVQPLLEPIRSGVPRPGDDIQHYHLLEELGRGGMGVVYRARDRHLDRAVALKLLPWHLSADAQARQRFMAEAQAAASLEHPNVCAIHEVGEWEGRFFLTMPFYAGESLDRRMARGLLPVPDVLNVGTQVARGLAAAHERGIVHRDVKPGNIMLLSRGPVKILDFGVAKTGAALTEDGQVIGTAAYMSPEQSRADAVDPRTDLWSLGVMLYEMATGLRPFDDRGVTNGYRRPDPPSTTRGDVPRDFDVLVSRLLEENPKDRPSSAAAVAEALERLEVGADTRIEASTVERAKLVEGGERRQMTVLTVIYPDHARMVERLPPDELEGAISRRRRRAEVVVEREGGVVTDYSDARLTAVFGVPVTREDDAERGVEAALTLAEATDDTAPGDAARIGIATGLAVARRSGEHEAGFTLAGRPIELAAAIGARADPGSVLVASETQRLIAGHYRTEAAADVPPAAPDEEPIRVHRVTARRESESSPWKTGREHLSPYSGRDREFSALQREMEEASGGDGRLVVVLGEAGVGKSRLVHEALMNGGDPSRVLVRGRCQPHGVGAPYLPFVEALRDLLEVQVGLGPGAASADVVAERIQDAAPELGDFLPLYLNLLGIPSERHPLPRHLRGEHFKVGIREALAAIFTVGLGGRSGVLVLEDWHWADEASHDVLLQLVEVLPGTPLLILVTCRPGYDVEWSSSMAHTPIFLRPLPPEASGVIVAAALDAREVMDDARDILHERAGGNPFFLEELCHTLREEGAVEVSDGVARLRRSAESLHLPDTVQGVIRTRLDRLEPDVKGVLRVASVIGREFSVPLLERSLSGNERLEDALDALKRLGLGRQIKLVPEPIYRFSHALTQEVVYDTLLQHQRAALHARVGAAMEAHLAERGSDEHPERLSHHFSRAENWPRAIHWGRRWAARAEALSEFVDALEILDRIEGWIERLPDQRSADIILDQVLLDQERLCETLGRRERQLDILDRLLARLTGSEDTRRLAEVHRRRGDAFTLLVRFDDAAEALEQAWTLVQTLDDPGAERHTLRSMGLLSWHAGRYDEALERVERAVAIGRTQQDEGLVGDLTNLAQLLKDLGQHDRALKEIEEALELGHKVGDALKKAYLLHVVSNIERARGRLDRAVELLEQASEHAREHRMPIQLSFHLTSIAHIRLQQDRVEEALDHYLKAVDVGRKVRNADGLGHALRMTGEVLLQLDRAAEAVPLLEEAVALYGQLGRRDLEAQVWAHLAAARQRIGDWLGAVGAWTRVRELRQDAGDRVGELEAVEGLAAAVRKASGDPAASLPHYYDALRLAQALDDRGREWELRNTLGIIAWRTGAYHRALEHYRRGAELARQTGSGRKEGLALNSLGVTLRSLDRRGEAGTVLREALEVHRRNGDRLLEGHALASLADLDADMGDVDSARRRYEASLRLRTEVGDTRGEGWMLYRMAALDRRSGRTDGVVQALERAASIAGEVADDELAHECRRLQRVE